ncbi:MAG TPA: AmmeMemoRadiSam system protein B, partial [Thermoanaerobaculia bacterium]|nr:AmmeMemoRadiSam system protein B [Thermoanaerobaculia bacterium]
GMFYEGTATRLRRQVEECLPPPPRASARRFVGAVAPHAGLMYSGHVAGALYAELELPRRFIILCPNHTGLGTEASINSSGAWRTPLGDVRVDEPLARAIVAEAPFVREDELAHAREHSLEVQLPFLQILAEEFTFVPLCLSLPTFERTAALGRAVAAAVRGAGEPVGIIASSDLNHYENQETTLRKDGEAIERLLALDAEGLWRTVREKNISMCGYIPATAMLVAANELGASSASLVRHATSGDVTGDYSAVVGYAAIAVA